MAFTQIQVTGSFQSTTGSEPAAGQLTFTLTRPMSNSNVIVTPSPITATLDDDGSFNVTLVANDDPDTAPSGVWYGVTEQIIDGQPRDYFIVIPAAADGGIVDISTLMPGTAGWS